MKKWHYPVLFVTIVAAVAVGTNFGTIYESAMFSMTGDCKYWDANRSGDLNDAKARKKMSLAEHNCALDKFIKDMKRQNSAY